MKYFFCMGDLEEADFNKIYELDKRYYEKKYVISAEDTKKRFNKNSNIFFTIRDIKGRLIGYTSVIPLKNKTYVKIKNGEIDKEVIKIADIISANEKVNDLYFDSIIIDSKYRKQRLGGKLLLYAFEQLTKLYPDCKRVLGNAVSEGGLKLLEKRGLRKVKKKDNPLVIVEKVMKGKAYARKKKYKDRDKRIVETKNITHSFVVE